MQKVDFIVIGGGAAGFFAAIHAAERGKKVVLLEKTRKLLSKVRISGGGRCNVTHSCFDPRQLILRYPRGSKELLGPFTRFQPRDTIRWFEEHGVMLKTEEDGRMFPVTDDSETIISCLIRAAHQVDIHLGVGVDSLSKVIDEWVVGEWSAPSVLLATGSSPQGYSLLEEVGHVINPPVPSLFTFNTPTSPLLDLSGISLPKVTVSVDGLSLEETGPLLLTHFGFSGPAVLRLSAWGARDLFAMNYQATLKVDWTGGMSQKELQELLLDVKKSKASQPFSLDPIFDFPKALSRRFQELLELKAKRFADLSSKDMQRIIELLQNSRFKIEGKTTHKQEFVTCGGVKLSDVNFKTMESRICPGLYFAGEILDIDGITGGFNFQNAWTTGWIVGMHV